MSSGVSEKDNELNSCFRSSLSMLSVLFLGCIVVDGREGGCGSKPGFLDE